ncbi:DgyrCDS3387 [Dimorphilus gyrociliatus]|uniref:Ataxin-3 homolog n=1 Tax=Dimorphilus gyrociliatus TaxID=2664684 RepID=A0A7I8VG35_9ANNE|nr:DgyrCDS3387 [Dimorphilus gyrociliatus]
MDLIFHEKQEGSLCGQHCLNNLLQGAYFSAVDLADLASQLDETERSHLGSNSSSTSHNMDDSGYFSIQVLQKALEIWNICLFSFKSSRPEAVAARIDAHSQKAYICNFQDHWFSIRKIGLQWFNLNSMHSAPELISDTYLSLFLAQLQTDGYSIFVVSGNLPDCDADAILKLAPIEANKVKLNQTPRSGSENSSDLEKALEESRQMNEENDESLQRALKESLQEYEKNQTSDIPQCQSTSRIPATQEELRRKRLEKFGSSSN